MKVQVNTDSSVKGDQRLESIVDDVVDDKLSHFRNNITRVEVHIRDENSEKGGPDDKRCMMEARLRGLDPVAVTHHASSIDSAINGAANKLRRSVRKTVDRHNQHR